MNDLECLKINYDVDGWKTISEREGNHCIVPLGAVYAIRSLIEEIEQLRAGNADLGKEIQRLTTEKGYCLESLREHADAAIDETMRDPESKNWCVNWGDIACVSAQKFNDDGGDYGYRVVLEEASCYHLSKYVKDYLEQRGFVGVDVITEW